MKIFFLLSILFFITNSSNLINTNTKNKNISEVLLSQLNVIDEFKDFAFGAQLGANSPCEDTYFIKNITLLNYEGIFFSIFDGHGGDKLSKYANLLLYPYFMELFNLNKFEQNLNERIIISLKQAYEKIEREYLQISVNEKLKDVFYYAQGGTCALSVIIINKKIFVANLGDSKARLFYVSNKYLRKKNSNQTKKFKVKKVTKVFNIRKKSEQIMYKKKFPRDKDIIRCYQENACYVKGQLQPTRTLGDYTLKYIVFNLNKLYDDTIYDQFKQFFNGPYISAVPDIQVYDIKSNFWYLIAGTDGLWDVVKSSEIAEMINLDNNNNENITYDVFRFAMDKYSKENDLNGNLKKILDTPPGGERRNLHDDITIITCDLRKFF